MNPNRADGRLESSGVHMGFGTLRSMRVASCRRGETNWPGKQQPGMKKGAAGWVKGPDGGATLSFNPECVA